MTTPTDVSLFIFFSVRYEIRVYDIVKRARNRMIDKYRLSILLYSIALNNARDKLFSDFQTNKKLFNEYLDIHRNNRGFSTLY